MHARFGSVAAALAAMFVSLGGSSVTSATTTDDGARFLTSCSASTACLSESNTSIGPGIKSTSAHGDGLAATTSALGSLSSNGASALRGEDLQTKSGDGLYNFGVNGSSANGTGVQGSGGTAGVTGISTGTDGVAVRASTTTATGLLFEGYNFSGLFSHPVFSVDTNGNAVFGDSETNNQAGSVTVYQHCGSDRPSFVTWDQSGPVYQVSDCGDTDASGSVAAAGGLLANQISSYSGGEVTVNSLLLGEDGLFSASDGSTNYTASDDAGVTWLYQGYSASAGKYTVELGDSGSVYARIFLTMAPPHVVQKTSTGVQEDTYVPQITQPSLEDFGEARLTDGVASVALDPKFAAAIDGSTRYLVTLTPEGDCRGLYVASQTPSGFTVRELQGGRSSVAFNFRIVARPLGDDSPRLPQSSLPYGFDHHVPPPIVARKTVHRGALRAM
jgi:hypothetical protein